MVQTTNYQQNSLERDFQARQKQASKISDLTRYDAFNAFETSTSPNNDGQQPSDFKDQTLTIHGELNKFIANGTLTKNWVQKGVKA